MKRKILLGILGMALVGVAGCSAFSSEPETPPDYSNISVMVREGVQLKTIIAQAAQRRGWSVLDAGEDSLRLTISQRSNLVEVNATVIDECHYSLHLVNSNIPTRKYVQWVNNLQRTVANLAL